MESKYNRGALTAALEGGSDELVLENGKYTVVLGKDGSFRALRYGEPWRDLTGDNLIAAMFYEITRLRADSDMWKSQVHDEIAANLAFREAIGARPDEDMPTLCDRLVNERAECVNAAKYWAEDATNKALALSPGQREAMLACSNELTGIMSGAALAAEQASVQAKVPDVGACRWQKQDEYGDHVSTGCGHEFILNDASDYDDGKPVFPFCCYCAKPTVFRQWRDEPECTCDNGDGPECFACADRRALSHAEPQGGGDSKSWRAIGACMDAKALATAQEIAHMWGQDRSQFVSRIQVAVLDAMEWMGTTQAAPPAPAAVAGGDAIDAALRDALKDGTGVLRVQHVPQAALAAQPAAGDIELLRDLIDYAESGKVAEPYWIDRMKSMLAAAQRPVVNDSADQNLIKSHG